jgi:hypothetical protein
MKIVQQRLGRHKEHDDVDSSRDVNVLIHLLIWKIVFLSIKVRRGICASHNAAFIYAVTFTMIYGKLIHISLSPLPSSPQCLLGCLLLPHNDFL